MIISTFPDDRIHPPPCDSGFTSPCPVNPVPLTEFPYIYRKSVLLGISSYLERCKLVHLDKARSKSYIPRQGDCKNSGPNSEKKSARRRSKRVATTTLRRRPHHGNILQGARRGKSRRQGGKKQARAAGEGHGVKGGRARREGAARQRNGVYGVQKAATRPRAAATGLTTQGGIKWA